MIPPIEPTTWVLVLSLCSYMRCDDITIAAPFSSKAACEVEARKRVLRVVHQHAAVKHINLDCLPVLEKYR